MPGSPLMSTNEPGTMPPPSTKSNSLMPVFQRGVSEARRSPSLVAEATFPAVASGGPAARARPAAVAGRAATSSSTSVFHSPHVSQRPDHFGCSAPHSVQRYAVRALLFIGSLLARCRVVLEPRVRLVKEEIHETNWSVALLANDDLGAPFERVAVLVGRAVVDLLPVDEHHEIGVLLDGAGLAEIGELGAMVARSMLGRARELRQRDHGHRELLGEGLERAQDLADLLLAAL